MYNKVNSKAVKGRRKPGRPFNTTSYPWRSTAIGKSFWLNNCNPPSGQMMERLRNEGFNYSYRITDYGTIMTRIS